VQEASPRPVNQRQYALSPNKKGETLCDPPRPLRMANSALSGTLIGMVSMRVIFTIDKFVHKRVTSSTIFQEYPAFFAVARVGSPTVPLFEIS